ncbi:hypothetical protein TRVA0_005S01596 [Trichomonascus vanleenenianus]|uniref:uncharacterized protein n=1 Tax=Trichomonascus vanleenenianus TaxID=2268995 RepID=UPI003ECB2B83
MALSNVRPVLQETTGNHHHTQGKSFGSDRSSTATAFVKRPLLVPVEVPHKKIKVAPHPNSYDSESDDENVKLCLSQSQPGTSTKTDLSALIKHQQRRNSQHHHRRRKSFAVPECDRQARQACFNYLISAIDEVWAQYCDCTSSEENEMYSEARGGPRALSFSESIDMPSSPAFSFDDDYSSDESAGPRTPGSCSSSNDNRRVTAAEVAAEKTKNVPQSVRLLNLKKRLLNAKYYLADLVDASDPVSSVEFWNRWDMIKYATIELVEEDGDEDETIESVTEELEQGRHYGRC